MKIAIIGYGRMGREIEKAALDSGHQVVCRIDSDTDWKNASDALKTAETAIEFSTPSTAPANILRCFERNLPVVAGTTGWYDRLPEIQARCEKEGRYLFVSSNFSLGVYLFMATARYLAQKMNPLSDYLPSIEEIHHIHKLDKPSGTALTLKKEVLKELNRCRDIDIESIREGEVPGIHSLQFTGAVDKIALTHEAFSRRGFASGALRAAEWLGKRRTDGASPGVFTMKDLMGF